MLSYPDVANLPETPDLAIIATPPVTVPRLISELGSRGTRAAIVITDDLEQRADTAQKNLRDAMLEHVPAGWNRRDSLGPLEERV